MENGCRLLSPCVSEYVPSWCDHTSQERGHLHAFNPLTSGNTHGKSASVRAFAVYAFEACITIQLLQLADANFEHSDIISSVNGGLITNCITLFFFATRSFGLSLLLAQWSLSGRSCGPRVNAEREHNDIICFGGGCLSILQLTVVNTDVFHWK